MKQTRRIKGINFNYDLPDELFIVGLDDVGVPEIQKVAVLGLNREKLLKLKQKIKVGAMSKMHYDAVRSSNGKKTIPYKSISEDPMRGNVFKSERLAIARIAHIRDQIRKHAEDMIDQTALIAARHDRYLLEYLNRKEKKVV